LLRDYLLAERGAVVGRNSVLDEGNLREICALATAGMSIAKIAKYVGCDRKTIYNARRDNPDFDQRMRRARLSIDLNPREAMRRFATTHWRAAAWVLERDERQEAARRAALVAEREAREAEHFSRDDLTLLAEEIKQLLAGALLDPFQRPQLLDRIDALFERAIPADDWAGEAGGDEGARRMNDLDISPTGELFPPPLLGGAAKNTTQAVPKPPATDSK